MKVSVVIPAYNEEKYIGNCLKSLQNQLVPADEIIVVDNNCTDNTINIVKQFPHVRIVKEKIPGIIAARNKGFNSAKYDILAKCDADSQLPPDWIQKIKNSFKTSTIAGITGPIYTYDLLPTHQKLTKSFSHYLFQISKALQGYYALYGSNMAITREIWEKVKDKVCVDDKKVHEDIDLGMHIHPYGKIKYDPSFYSGISARRVKNNPYSFIVEYQIRTIRTMKFHKHTL